MLLQTKKKEWAASKVKITNGATIYKQKRELGMPNKNKTKKEEEKCAQPKKKS